jgi:hypothetical protein
VRSMEMKQVSRNRRSICLGTEAKSRRPVARLPGSKLNSIKQSKDLK